MESPSSLNQPVLRKAQIRDVHFGKDVVVVEPANIYGCVIGDGCFIGPFVEIQKGVRIGQKCKIQSHAFVCELVTLGDHCIVSHGVMFINDRFATGKPAGGKVELWNKTLVGHHVLFGTNSTIMPVQICDHVVIGAGSVVTKDITEPGFYVGNPARRLRGLSAKV